MNDWATVSSRSDTQRGVKPARCRTSDEKRGVNSVAIEFACDIHHVIERRSDEAGEADDVDIMFSRCITDLLGRDHDAKIDDGVISTSEYDSNDVLSNVMHIARNGG